MFDVFFQSAAAFNQAGMLFGAFLCLGLGGLILGNDLYWRLKALRVQGTVIGVRKNKNTYRPVYRYMLPGGESAEATSDTGSNLVRGKETGSTHELLVFPDDPGTVRPANSGVSWIAGIIFLVPGFIFLKVALTSYEVTGYTWLMLAGIAVVLLLKLKKNFIPKDERQPPPEWRKNLRQRKSEALAAIPVRPIEEYLAAPEAAAEKERMAKTARWMTPLLALASLGMIWGGLHIGNRQLALDENGLRAQGVVVRLEASRSSDSTTWHPVVRFEDRSGHDVEFQDGMGSSPPSYRTGEEVSVLYLASSPGETAVIDRGVFNWAAPVALLLFGTLMGAAALGFYRQALRGKAL